MREHRWVDVDVVMAVEVSRLTEARAEAFELVCDHVVDQLAGGILAAVFAPALPAENLGKAKLAFAHCGRYGRLLEGEGEVEMQAGRQCALARQRCRPRAVTHPHHRRRRGEDTFAEQLDDRIGRAGAGTEVVGVDYQHGAGVRLEVVGRDCREAVAHAEMGVYVGPVGRGPGELGA